MGESSCISDSVPVQFGKVKCGEQQNWTWLLLSAVTTSPVMRLGLLTKHKEMMSFVWWSQKKLCF